MAKSLFDFVAGLLEERTDLEALEARGTLRIALKEAGLEAKGLAREELLTTLARVLPKHLTARGVENAEDLCAELAGDVRRAAALEAPQRSPEDVFRRLGGD